MSDFPVYRKTAPGDGLQINSGSNVASVGIWGIQYDEQEFLPRGEFLVQEQMPFV